MNKIEMIDKAIDCLGGTMPMGWNIYISGRNTVVVSTPENSLYKDNIYCRSNMTENYFCDEGYMLWKYVCTVEEFEQRLEERNNMNGYQPKIGEVCEMTWGNKVNWFECIVGYTKTLYNNEVNWAEATYELEDVEFRPIKSERDIAIENAIKIIEDDNNDFTTSNIERALGALYDMGVLTNETK